MGKRKEIAVSVKRRFDENSQSTLPELFMRMMLSDYQKREADTFVKERHENYNDYDKDNDDNRKGA